MAHAFEVITMPLGRISNRVTYANTKEWLLGVAERNPATAIHEAKLMIKYRNHPNKISGSLYILANSRSRAKAAIAFLKELR